MTPFQRLAQAMAQADYGPQVMSPDGQAALRALNQQGMGYRVLYDRNGVANGIAPIMLPKRSAPARSQTPTPRPAQQRGARVATSQGGFVGPSSPAGGFVGPSVPSTYTPQVNMSADVPAPPQGGFVGPSVPAPAPQQEFVGPVAPPGVVSMRNAMDTAYDAYNPWVYASNQAVDFVRNNIVGPVLDFADTYGKAFANGAARTIERYRPQVEGWANQNIMQPLRNEVDYFWRQRVPEWLGLPPYAPGNYDETQWRQPAYAPAPAPLIDPSLSFDPQWRQPAYVPIPEPAPSLPPEFVPRMDPSLSPETQQQVYDAVNGFYRFQQGY